MQAIARLKRGGRRSGFAAQSERHGIQHTDGNRASPASPNDQHGPFPKNPRAQVDLHGYQAQDESPVARIEPDGQCGEGPERNWMPLVDDCRCTVSAMDKLLHASNRLPHNRHPAVQVVGVNHATLHRTISQASAESPRSTKWRLT